MTERKCSFFQYLFLFCCIVFLGECVSTVLEENLQAGKAAWSQLLASEANVNGWWLKRSEVHLSFWEIVRVMCVPEFLSGMHLKEQEIPRLGSSGTFC